MVPRLLRIRVLLAVAITTLALVVSGCAGLASGGAEEGTIRYQGSAGSVNVLELADALGYLDGVELDKVGDVTGGPEALRALASRQVDIAISPFFGATAQLVATGAPLKAVVSTYGSSGDISSSVVVLEGSEVASARDLIGRKVAVNTLGANAEAVLATWFDQEGLSQEEIEEVTLVPLPPLNMEQALREGQVDAAYLSIGGLTNARRQGGVAEIMKDTDVVGPYNGGGSVMTEKFLDEHPDTATTVVTGIARAVEYVESHERDEVLAVYHDWLVEQGYEDAYEAVESAWPGSTGVPSEHAQISDTDISLWLDWLGSRGDVDPDDIEPGDVYTNEYNLEAK